MHKNIRHYIDGEVDNMSDMKEVVVIPNYVINADRYQDIHDDKQYKIVDVTNGKVLSLVKGNTLKSYISSNKYNIINTAGCRPGIFRKYTFAPKGVVVKFNNGQAISNDFNVNLNIKTSNDALIIKVDEANITLGVSLVKSKDSRYAIMEGYSGGDSIKVNFNSSISNYFIGYKGKIEQVAIYIDRICIYYDCEDFDNRPYDKVITIPIDLR